MSLDLATVKSIYRDAIDARAHDAEGDAWWLEVAAEVQAVVAAPTDAAAASVIVWWHNDWSTIRDTPFGAAQRMRAAAGRILVEQ